MQKTTHQMPNASYWEQESFFHTADFAVIGSGIVGLNAALEFKTQTPQARVIVLERSSLPQGASTRNAGFACFGSPTELLDDLQHHTEAEVWALVAERWHGLQRMREKLGDQAIGYEAYGGYEVFRTADEAIFEQCMEQLPHFNQQLEAITGIQDAFILADEDIEQFGFAGVRHLIKSRIEGQLHPGKMMRSLQQQAQAAGIELWHGFEVANIDPTETLVHIHSAEGMKLSTRQLLVATNGFAKRLLPDLALTPARNQVLITKPIPDLKFKGCFHYEQGYFYFRNVGNRVLLGGGRNLARAAEETDLFGMTKLIQKALEELLQTVILPEQVIEIEQWWSGILGVGVQKQPIIELVHPRMGVAVRMGGMGVAIGTRVGERAAHLFDACARDME